MQQIFQAALQRQQVSKINCKKTYILSLVQNSKDLALIG